jgi:polyisoprenyl-phosphate glycosyltransferase
VVKIKILIPVFNDWKSVFKLLENIDKEFDTNNSKINHLSVIIINDASTEEKPAIIYNFKNLESIHILNMKKNRGHARCNATGLKYVSAKEEFDYVIPMDGDGEDRPEELSLFINKIKDYPDKVITANRIKRSEGLIFRFCYLIHKYLTLVFTGQLIRYGNYTCLPKFALNQMLNEKATWSSFSGSVAKLFKHIKSIPSIRGNRYFGPSKMSFLNLLKHSFSIIAVFKKTFLVRSIFFLLSYLFLIFDKISIITLIPVAGVMMMMISVITLSKRENISEFNNSLDNIEKIDIIK